MTFSIVAYDPNTGDFGVAVQSKFLCVGAMVPFAKSGVGAVATQAFCNVSYGPKGLGLMKKGFSAEETLKILLDNDPQKEQRQIGIVDSKGNTVSFTGKECFYWAGGITGTNFAVQGNILVSEETVEDMAKAFETTKGDLADRLLAVLDAADHEGRGDVRGKQSAALLIVRENAGYGGFTDRYIDLRVDEHKEPIKEIRRIFNVYNTTMLSREDPANLMPIEGTIAVGVKKVLYELGYLQQSQLAKPTEWGLEEKKALDNWVGINNFENRMTQEGKIWKSIYEYMLKEKGTPMVKLRSMSEL